MSSNIVYLNGSFMRAHQAKISVMDRGFLFADGVYEVIPAYDGYLFKIDEHMERLRRSLEAVRIDVDTSPSRWQTLFAELMQRNGLTTCSIYLQITRGAPEIRDHSFPEDTPPTIFAMCNPMKKPMVDHGLKAPGGTAITTDDIRWKRCDIKSISLLPNTLMRQKAIDAGADEAIMMRDGMVTEGAASNVFIIKDNIIKTPARGPFILGGITRDAVLELAKSAKLPTEECDLFEDDLRQADEIWTTSSTKEVVPITTLDGQAVGDGEVGPMWKQIAALYFRQKRRFFSL